MKSKLAAQLAEATEHARNLNAEASKFSGLKGAFAGDLAIGIPSGGGGGAAGVPGAPGAPSGGALSAGTVAEFLARLANKGPTTGTGESAETGGRTRAASPEESLQAEALGESVEYLRKLMAAAAWAGLSQAAALRAPKGERDALIAAWEAAGSQGGTGGGGGAGAASGGGPGAPVDRSHTNLGPLNGHEHTNLGPLNGHEHTDLGALNGADHSSLAPLAKGSSAAPDPTPAINSGAQATVGALGAVVQELKRLNTNVERKSTGVEYRTGGLT